MRGNNINLLDMANKASILNWVTGILASIISALIVWKLTNPEGGKKQEVVIESKNPVLKISAFEIKQPFIAKNEFSNSADAKITIFNAGNDIANNCKIIWECPPNEANMNQLEEFSLLAGESKTFIISSPYWNKSKHYNCAIIASCTNCLPDSLVRSIEVISDFEIKSDTIAN